MGGSFYGGLVKKLSISDLFGMTTNNKQKQRPHLDFSFLSPYIIQEGLRFNLNALRPSEHPSVRVKKCQNVLGGIIGCKDNCCL